MWLLCTMYVPSPSFWEPVLPPTPILSCGHPVTVLLGLLQSVVSS